MLPSEVIIKCVTERGAVRAKEISIDNIVIDERVHFKCLVPRCPDYGICPTCPPNTLSVDKIKEVISKYESVVILQVDTILEPNKDYYEGANLLHKIVLEGEKAAFIAGARFATGLIGGSCHLCSSCREGKKCPSLDKPRPSMEAMCIDVFATAELAGFPIKFPVSDKVTWTGLILI